MGFLLLCASYGILHCVGAVSDGGKAFRLPLSDDASIPAMGLGTFLGFDDKGQKIPAQCEVSKAVEWAIDAGYRLIDTAPVYRDEDQIGEGLANKMRDGTVKREDIFLVTKLPSTHHGRRQVLPALRDSLKSLRLEYVDLYLVHWPMGLTEDNKYDGTDYLDTWKGMEDVQRMGLARSIGLSNFNVTQIQRVLDNAQIKPTVLQVEINLNLYQASLVNFCKSHDIAVMAYAPFGSLWSSAGPAPKKDDPKLVEIAAKYNTTAPQVVIHYLVERGLIPIPKSVNKNRIEQNINIFDFKLDADDIKTLDAFNRDYRTVLPSFWQNHPHYPFEKKETPAENPF